MKKKWEISISLIDLAVVSDLKAHPHVGRQLG